MQPTIHQTTLDISPLVLFTCKGTKSSILDEYCTGNVLAAICVMKLWLGR